MKSIKKYCMAALAVAAAVSMATACIGTSKDTADEYQATVSDKPLPPPDDETLITLPSEEGPTEVPLSSIESLDTDPEIVSVLEEATVTEEEITIPDDVAATLETMEKFGKE